MIPAFLENLLRRYFRSPNFLWNRSGAASLPFKSLRPHWILGRGLCMYRYENFDHVPRPKRAAALKFKVPSWSPFDRTGYFVVWSGGDAMVWYWDGQLQETEARREALLEAGVDPARCIVLPESLFRPRQTDGIHLQQCGEGVEIQYWRHSVLRGAFWSAEAPSPQRLAWFADRHGVDAISAEGAQPPLHDELLSEPWSADISSAEWLAGNELRLAAGLALILSVVLVWQGARQWKYGLAGNEFDEAFSLIQDEVTPFMQARDGFRDLNRINEQLDTFLHEPSQAYLMGLVDQAVPEPDAHFDEWHYQAGELRIVVTVDGTASPVEYVQRLEEQPAFTDVRTEQASGRNKVEFSMKVAL